MLSGLEWTEPDLAANASPVVMEMLCRAGLVQASELSRLHLLTFSALAPGHFPRAFPMSAPLGNCSLRHFPPIGKCSLRRHIA